MSEWQKVRVTKRTTSSVQKKNTRDGKEHHPSTKKKNGYGWFVSPRDMEPAAHSMVWALNKVDNTWSDVRRDGVRLLTSDDTSITPPALLSFIGAYTMGRVVDHLHTHGSHLQVLRDNTCENPGTEYVVHVGTTDEVETSEIRVSVTFENCGIHLRTLKDCAGEAPELLSEKMLFNSDDLIENDEENFTKQFVEAVCSYLTQADDLAQSCKKD